MEKLQRSQFAKLVLIALFVLLFTPFVSTWMKPPFLFLLLNLLILALGAESGIFTSKVHEEQPSTVTTTTTTTTTIFVSHKEKKDEKRINVNSHGGAINTGTSDGAKVVENPTADNIVKVVTVRRVKKCPSTPSLFFIDDPDGRSKEEVVEEDAEEAAAEEMSPQELFAKAESFIGNFYKQLRMQREESWQRIQDLYHRTI